MKQKRRRMMAMGEGEHKPSSSDLIRMMGGRSRPAGRGRQRGSDSVIAIYKERVTYTFVMGEEVASIHFDSSRGEIFFRGHNIRNMQLNEKQLAALEAMKGVLAADQQGKEYLSAYSATLARLIADK